MSRSHQIQQPSLSNEEAKVILKAILDAFESRSNKSRMREVREAAGNDMMKMMQMVFPVATQIQQDVLQNYGFTGDGEGAIKFTHEVRWYEQEDPEIARLSQTLKEILLPALPVAQLPS